MVYSLWLGCTTRCKLGCMGANYCMHDASRVLLPTTVTRVIFMLQVLPIQPPAKIRFRSSDRSNVRKAPCSRKQQHAPTEL